MTDIARLVLDADTKGLKRGEDGLRDIGSQAARTAGDVDASTSRIGTAFKKIGVALVAAGIGTVLFDFGKKATQAAIDAEEMGSAFEVVFGNMADDVRAWAEETGNALGRSTQEIQRGALAFQELFGKALDPSQAAELSKQFAVLTQDLASFKNLSNEVAQQKLFSGLTGEAEPLRAVGVFINDAAVQAKGLELGLSGVNNVLTDQEKIVARAALIQEQLANAQGDVIRTSDSAANQIKTYEAAVEELQVAIGQKLLPTFTPLVTGAAEIVTQMAALAQGTSQFSQTLDTAGRVVLTAAGGWAAYRVALLGAQGVTLIMNSTMAANASILLAVQRNLGTAAAAQTAFGVATASASGLFRAFTAALIANPFTAVAVAVGVLTSAMIGLSQAQAQARAETNNLIGSLRGLAQARSADFAAKRAEADLERNRLSGEVSRLEAQRARLSASAELSQRPGGDARAKALTQEIFAARQELVKVEGELRAADFAFRKSGEAADSMVAPVAQATTTVASLGGSLEKTGGAAREAARETEEAANKIKGLMDRLFPEVERQRQIAEDLALIETAGLDGSQRKEARIRIASGQPEEPQLPQVFDLEEAQRKTEQVVRETVDGIQEEVFRSEILANKMAEEFERMSQRVISSFQNLANGIKQGDFLSILGGAIDLFAQVGGFQAIGLGRTTVAPSNRSMGGPVYAGKPYIVGENGPEMFSPPGTGRITANDNMRQDVRVTVGIDERNGNILAFVDGRIASSAPLIADAGASRAITAQARSGYRSL